MQTIFEEIADQLVYVLIAGCFLAGIIARAVTTIVTSASRERSRREIAAYIAEGTIGPEQGERLIRADVNRGGRVCG